MFLASTPSHVPLAAFDHYEDAEAYLCSLTTFSLRYVCTEPLKMSNSITRVYVESYGEGHFPEQTLGYITSGVQINPNYIVR